MTSNEDSPNAILRPSKISKGNTYWLFEYDDDRVTTIKEYRSESLHRSIQYNYDSDFNIISTTGATTANEQQFFDNGTQIEFYIFDSMCGSEDDIKYFYDTQYRLIQEDNNDTVCAGDGSIWTNLFDTYYTYDVNNNLVSKEFINSVNAIVVYIEEYFYDDKNHPFKNIDQRCRTFLSLPNGYEVVDGSIVYDWPILFSPYLKGRSFNNNRLGILGEDVLAYNLIYNEQGYPIEMEATSGSTFQNIYIEY